MPCVEIVMRKWISFLILLIASADAVAEWTRIGGANGVAVTTYIAMDSIRANGDLVKMWNLYDFSSPQRGPNSKSYLSIRLQSEYSCKGARSRVVSTTFHAGNMASGLVVHASDELGEWSPVAPDSIQEGEWKLACAVR